MAGNAKAAIMMKRILITTMVFAMLLPGCTSGTQSVVATNKSTTVDSAVQRGSVLFKEGQTGLPACSTCHTLDDSRLIGPGLRGIASRAGQRVPGETAKDYLYHSIVQPGAYIVQGYGNVMPADYGKSLSDQQIQDLIAYLQTLT